MRMRDREIELLRCFLKDATLRLPRVDPAMGMKIDELCDRALVAAPHKTEEDKRMRMKFTTPHQPVVGMAIMEGGRVIGRVESFENIAPSVYKVMGAMEPGISFPHSPTMGSEKYMIHTFELEPTASGEAVDHPAHYGGADNAYEAIKVIEAWSLGFCLGNAVKYISRAGRKDPSKKLEDLEKARWYLDREISGLRGDKAPAPGARALMAPVKGCPNCGKHVPCPAHADVLPEEGWSGPLIEVKNMMDIVNWPPSVHVIQNEGDVRFDAGRRAYCRGGKLPQGWHPIGNLSDDSLQDLIAACKNGRRFQGASVDPFLAFL